MLQEKCGVCCSSAAVHLPGSVAMLMKTHQESLRFALAELYLVGPIEMLIGTRRLNEENLA